MVLQNENVLAWHKTPTTSNIQDGVEEAIAAVIKKADIPRDNINSINIGTTVGFPMSSIVSFRISNTAGLFSFFQPPYVLAGSTKWQFLEIA